MGVMVMVMVMVMTVTVTGVTMTTVTVTVTGVTVTGVTVTGVTVKQIQKQETQYQQKQPQQNVRPHVMEELHVKKANVLGAEQNADVEKDPSTDVNSVSEKKVVVSQVVKEDPYANMAVEDHHACAAVVMTI